MKKNFLLVIFLVGSLVFAQDIDDDFDAIFENAGDITAEENDKINSPRPITGNVFPNSSIFKFYGHNKSEMGLIYGHRFGDLEEKYFDKGKIEVREGEFYRENWGAGYFDFENHISFVARPDDSFAFHGNLCTTFFPIKWVNDQKSTLYFDYMAGHNCIVSAGKKTLNWGYVRIFNNVTDYSQEERLTTNIVADSESSIIGSLTFPLSFMTATGVILYNFKNGVEFSKDNPPKLDELSYAGSLEFSFLQASLNLYFRRTARDVSSLNAENETPYGINNVIGIEAKRTVFGFDSYVQNTFRFNSPENLRSITSINSKSEVITFGTYRLWERWGFNAEFQNFYSIEEKSNSQRIALDLGVRKVGPKKDLKLILQWRHDTNNFSSDGEFLDNSWVKLGLVKSNFFKHLDWVNGVQVHYRLKDEPGVYQARLASYFTLNIDY